MEHSDQFPRVISVSTYSNYVNSQSLASKFRDAIFVTVNYVSYIHYIYVDDKCPCKLAHSYYPWPIS
jgi:hypothetical protein